MKTKSVISKETAIFAATELTKIFPKAEKKPEYSIGYQRWTKLTKKQRNELLIIHDCDYNKVINYLQVA